MHMKASVLGSVGFAKLFRKVILYNCFELLLLTLTATVTSYTSVLNVNQRFLQKLVSSLIINKAQFHQEILDMSCLEDLDINTSA